MIADFRKVIFYTLEKAIRSYRQFAQRKLKEAGLKITVDQWLTLNCLHRNPEISQKQLAEIIFKDAASVTRILNLLIRHGYLKKAVHAADKRKSQLLITAQGQKLIVQAQKVVSSYRSKALKGLTQDQLALTQKIMQSIIKNVEK